MGNENRFQGIPPGRLVQRYSDLASGVLAPEDMRIEDLEFRVKINPDGTIEFSTDPITLISRYNFAISDIAGFAMDPDLLGAAAALVSFQVRESGRNFDIFKRPISMAALLQPSGPNIASWLGTYVTVPGTDVEVDWTVDTQRWPSLVGAYKEMGIQIRGDYVACAPR
jgi:hypothetical protein